MFSGGEVKTITAANCKGYASANQCEALVEACAANTEDGACTSDVLDSEAKAIKYDLSEGDAAAKAAKSAYTDITKFLTTAADEKPAAPVKKKKVVKEKAEEVEEDQEAGVEGDTNKESKLIHTHALFREKKIITVLSGVYSVGAAASEPSNTSSGITNGGFDSTNLCRQHIACGEDVNDPRFSGGSATADEWTSYGVQGEVLYGTDLGGFQLGAGLLAGYRAFTSPNTKLPRFSTVPILVDAKLVAPIGSSFGLGLTLLGGWQLYLFDKEQDSAKSYSDGRYIVNGENIKDFGVLTFGGKGEVFIPFSDDVGLSLGLQFMNAIESTATQNIGRDAKGKEYVSVPADGRLEILGGILGAW